MRKSIISLFLLLSVFIITMPVKARNIIKFKEKFKKSSISSSHFMPLNYKKEENIFKLYKTFKKKIPRLKSKIYFQEKNTELIIGNAYYSIGLSKENGAIQYIKDKIKNRIVSRGSIDSTLWQIIFKNNKNLSSKLFLKNNPNNIFRYKWLARSKLLKLKYINNQTGFSFIVNIKFNKKHFFDFQCFIKNKFKQPIIAAGIPHSLSFSINKLKRFYFPWKMGLYFNKNFFLSKKYISEPYPFLFADFISIESEDGNLSVYMIHNKNSFQQTRLNVGYNAFNGGVGMYGHEFATYIKKGETWKSPILRFYICSSVEESVVQYAKDNGLDKTPSLKKKISSKLFHHLRHGVLLKIDFIWANMSFKEAEAFIKTLPSSTILHLLSFWPRSFDQNYPDYIPPNPRFGTSNDLKHFIRVAHKHNLLIMPYTNPTWWNESLTLDELGKENIAVRRLNGKIHDEYYWGKNWGIVVSPHHPLAIKRMNQTAKQFAYDFKCDLLFEDQLGARSWIYDLNPKAKAPAGYTRGIINIAKRDHKKIPLMTEGGFDKLIQYETGFCDMSVNKALPPDKIYNNWWGKGNWKIFPMMLYFIHSKVAVYQHNLAHEVFTDAREKLTWNLAYGHNLFLAWWPSEWSKYKKWFKIADAFQKTVAARSFGKDLTEYREIEKHVTWSRFKDIGIIANHNVNKDFVLKQYVIAPGGFLAQSVQKDLKAGLFTVYNYRPLAGECFIIEEHKKDKIIVQQLSQKNTLLSIIRPLKWKNSKCIQCFCGKEQVPVAVNSRLITFLYKKDKTRYHLIYKKPKSHNIDLILQTSKQEVIPGEQVKVTFLVQNKSKNTLNQGKLILTSTVLNSASHQQRREEQPEKIIQFNNLKPGKEVKQDYMLQLASTLKPGERIWIKGELTYTLKKGKIQKQAVRCELFVRNALEIQYSSYQKNIQPGDKVNYELLIDNVFFEKKKADIILNIKGIPENWVKLKQKNIVIPGKNRKKVNINIQVSKQPVRRDGVITAKIKTEDYTYQADPVYIKVVPVLKQVEITPYVLIKGKEQKLTIKIRAYPYNAFSGQIYIKAPALWKINKKRFNIKLSPGEVKEFDFTVIPDKQGIEQVEVFFKRHNKKFKYSKKLGIIPENKATIFKSDVNDDGHEDIILGNNKLEFCVSSIMGGRILTFYNRSTGHNQLYTCYQGMELTDNSSENWVEYGGINDCLPVSWPGDIWNNKWKFNIVNKTSRKVVLIMKTKTKNNLSLTRKITLFADSSKVRLDYTVKNLSTKTKKFVWANHPDLAPGPEPDANALDKIIIPSDNKILKLAFGSVKQKNNYIPDQNWCVALDSKTGEYFAQKFDRKFVKEIGVWEGIAFYTMEIIFKEIELKAGEQVNFTLYYLTGQNDWQQKLKVK